jgi:hypothetical protein
LVWLRFSNTSNGLVDLCTVGSFPHPWLDLGLDFGGQPLAWLGCLINVSHALGSNPTVWDGIPAVCFMGNGWFGSGLGLWHVRHHGGDGFLDNCTWFLGEDLPLVAMSHDPVSRYSVHGFPLAPSFCRCQIGSACFANTTNAPHEFPRFCNLSTLERRESHAVDLTVFIRH